MPSLDDVSRISADLPGSVERATASGLNWFVRRRPFAWQSHPWPSEAEHIRDLVANEPCLTVRVPDTETRQALMQGWPQAITASETPWGGPRVIVRLERIDAEHLVELVTEAWYTEAPKYLRREYDAAHPEWREEPDGDLG